MNHFIALLVGEHWRRPADVFLPNTAVAHATVPHTHTHLPHIAPTHTTNLSSGRLVVIVLANGTVWQQKGRHNVWRNQFYSPQ